MRVSSNLTIMVAVCASALLVLACEGPAGDDGADGSQGTSCAVTDNGDGTMTIECEDGTTATVSDGTVGDPGSGCTVVDNGDGTKTITCGTDEVTINDGSDWPGPLPAEYVAADGIAGGAAYSKWWTSDGGGSGTSPSTSVAADFYRCKACHAWDGLGNAGSYANRTGQSTGRATRPDVSSVNLRSSAVSETPQELYDLIAHSGGRVIDAADNTHPDFANELSSEQIWDIVKFMREEWVSPGDLYELEVSGPAMYWDWSSGSAVLTSPTLTYSNIGKDGVATDGDAVYTASCASCHGADGKTITDVGGYSGVGAFVRAKPHEAWFKAKFGESGSMDSGLVTDTQDLKDLYKALTSTTTYPD
ncbi:MAG: c-type cytochrome [Deltaproteobacteria bacterium]|nr:c-type cytochrome [Deltaproteobacteria bacterium]